MVMVRCGLRSEVGRENGPGRHHEAGGAGPGLASRAQTLADRAAFFLTLVAIVAARNPDFRRWLVFGASAGFFHYAHGHGAGHRLSARTGTGRTPGHRHLHIHRRKNGLLVRDRRGLEEARKLDIVVFDKTGTLTLGEHRVVKIVAAEQQDQQEVLRLAAAVEHDSEHPIARALLESAREKELDVSGAEQFEAIPGHGVQARVGGRNLKVGGPYLLRKFDLEQPEGLNKASKSFEQDGHAVVYLIEGENSIRVRRGGRRANRVQGSCPAPA
jgi:P-type Cu2+ transporter